MSSKSLETLHAEKYLKHCHALRCMKTDDFTKGIRKRQLEKAFRAGFKAATMEERRHLEWRTQYGDLSK